VLVGIVAEHTEHPNFLFEIRLALGYQTFYGKALVLYLIVLPGSETKREEGVSSYLRDIEVVMMRVNIDFEHTTIATFELVVKMAVRISPTVSGEW